MKNAIQPGNIVTLTAPSGGVLSGNGYQIGDLFVVALASAAQGESFAAATAGAFTLPKTTSQEWGEGDLVYWKTGTKKVTSDDESGTNLPIGHAIAAAGSSATEGSVLLGRIMVVTAES